MESLEDIIPEFGDFINSSPHKGGAERGSPVQIALDGTLSLLRDRKQEIDAIFESEKLKKALEKVLITLCSEIATAVKSVMVVPEYSQKGASKQIIYTYIGTHWELTRIQIYYDFLKEACRIIGLSEVYIQNPDYMNKVAENVAYIISRHTETVQPVDGVWINLKNGTVEINGTSVLFREHRAEDFFQYCLPYSYDPNADCPRWLKFLDEVLAEKDAQTLLGEYIGYCFTQNLKLEKMCVFYGGGANGKSVCLDVIKRLLGRSNVSEATLSSITNDPEARSQLQNKLVNISSESGKNLNPAVLKMLISGEPVEMRILYVGTKTLYNPPKLITSYNELPPTENTLGYKRRWILIPFNKTIAEDKQDPNLDRKLAVELPGILNWVLVHLKNLVQNINSGEGGFTESKLCNEALTAYFKSSNSASMFVEECCKIDDGVTVKLKEVYQDYQNYCRCSGISKPLILKNFKKYLIDFGASFSVHLNVMYVNVYVDKTVYE